MSLWNNINLEGFCLFDSMKKKKETYNQYDKGLLTKAGKLRKPTKTITEDNPIYNKSPRPKWCLKKYPGRKERTPEFRCLCQGGKQCPFFMYSNVDKIDSEVMNAAFCINNDVSWDDDKMGNDNKCSRKFIKHMTKFNKDDK